MAVVSTLAVRDLVSRMAKATDESITVATKAVIASAEKLRDSIGGSTLFALFDTEGPERSIQQSNLDDAIQQLKNARTSDQRKAKLIYLQSTIEVSKTFYGQNDATARAFNQFLSDVAAAPGLLIEKVILPVVGGAAKFSGQVILGVLKPLWPLLLIAGVLIVGFVVARKKLGL